MYDSFFFQCILKSWQRCMTQKIPVEIKKPILCLNSTELKNKLKYKNDFILSFNKLIDRHLDLISNIKGCYYFALFDSDQNLIAVRTGCNHSMSYINEKEFLKIGVSYKENSIGTNAVTLSKLLKKPIYMRPMYHYCSILKNWYEYCVPIKCRLTVKGYITVISKSYPISKALEGFVDLLGINMNEELTDMQTSPYLYRDIRDMLTQKQYQILKMIAQGLTDKQISQELKISLSTVKYHNKNIFFLLDAESRVDAVVKALINNCLNIFDIPDDR